MKKLVIAIIIFGLIYNPLLSARGEEASYFNKEEFLASAGVKKTLQIAMVDCVAMALKNNSEILVKQISPRIEDANVRIQKSKFEPRLSFDWTMEDNTDLTSLTLIGRNPEKNKTAIFNFGYDQKFVTGTDIALDFFNTRTSSNSLIQNPNPMFDSEAQITVTQPLLKGFGVTVNKADFLIAKNNKLKSQQEFIQEVINVLTNVKKTYYGYQYTQEQYKVAKTSLERVEDLLYINKERYGKGLASNIDVVESEAEVARFEEMLYAAESMMKSAEDDLKYITNLVDDPELWNANIVLLEMLNYEKKDVDLVNAILTAFEHRPDYEAAKLALKNKDISVVFYKNNMLPTLDLVGTYGLNGMDKVYEKDLSHIGGGKYQDWSIGVSAKLPLFSDEEKGKYEKAKLEKARALIEFQRLEQKIILEVRNAVRDVDIKYKMLEASKKSIESERLNYGAQETRFRAGLVSTLDMVTYQERLAKAEVNYAKSVIDYNIALQELARVEGMMLINDNIKVEG